MSTIKVLHVIARMNVGGTARYISELVQNIPGSAVAIGYVQGAEIEDPAVLNMKVFRVPHMGRRISPINDFKSWLELRSLIKELSPEIVHTHTFKAGLLGRLVPGDHKRVHTFHGHLFGDQSFTSLEKMIILVTERYLSRKTDFLISVGSKVGVELRATGIGRHNDWASVPPGVLKLPNIVRKEARNILKLDHEAFVIGWMARMTRVKNPYLLLEVARRLPGTQFVMAGGGDLLEEICASAPENVKVMGWVNASTFWSSVDCAVSTSDNEGMPVALIEAQLSGLPVIATDVGSNSEVILDGKTGIIVQADASSIIDALLQIIDNPENFESMARLAAQLTPERFSLEKMIDSHLIIYETLFSKS
jgi:glycosyltransferase involved in cell wall biosynthesis